MKINSINTTNQVNLIKQANFYNPYLTKDYQTDNLTFKSRELHVKNFTSQRLFNKLLNKKLCNCNLKKLEGVQVGLKSFKNMSMKQIATALADLHAINMISGCTRHCLHCFANAQPFIKRGSFEDLKQICDDIKELESRTGAKPCYHHGEGYINISFDADALDSHLFDKEGQKHDFIDIAKLIYDSTGYKPVFDTNGWDTKEKQVIAENYVKKLLKNDNYKNFYQINISINPFNPKYVKALKSGYPVEKLYSPFKKIILEPSLDKEDDQPNDLKKAQELYTNYVKSVANTLLTFKPLIQTEKLVFIIRTISNNISNMSGYKTNDFAKTLGHICNELNYRRYFGELSEKEFEFYRNKLRWVDNKLFTSGRMEKFYKVSNNGSLKDIEKIDPERDASKSRLEKIKNTHKLSSGKLRYLKMISPDGRVFLYDNYAIIPTDIKLNTSVKETKKPFQIPVEDFVLTEEMIDIL